MYKIPMDSEKLINSFEMTKKDCLDKFFYRFFNNFLALLLCINVFDIYNTIDFFRFFLMCVKLAYQFSAYQK